jgi:hypothetical protein
MCLVTITIRNSVLDRRFISVNNFGPGSYTVTYSPQELGSYGISVFVNGMALSAKR